MNSTVAISHYTKVKQKTSSAAAVGHDVISSALQKLQSDLKLLLTTTEKKVRAKAFEGALLSIYYLQKGLDFSKGGELANNLFRLYEFCRLQVIEAGASLGQKDHEIEKCHLYISEILLVWKSIKE
ncbi:MAG: hypothetical protein CMM39_13065 [Rhodospirillaceae bacterium]|nr:hypothetical protein [Rhodospirillaceae bacterium]|tara:strand:+ start:1077 stop:1454 length:378 start_codon:yes stop_codon:yes gene_type:complete